MICLATLKSTCRERDGRSIPVIAQLAVLLAITAAVLLVSLQKPATGFEPLFVDAGNDTVLIELPLSAAWQSDAVKAVGVDEAASQAGLSLRLYAKTGDARFVRTAQRVIAPFSESTSLDPAIRMLQARLQQSAHQFSEAVETLQPLLDSSTYGAEASLLTADSLRRMGELSQARRACLQLAITGRTVLTRVCSAEIRLAAGDPAAAWRIVQPALALATDLAPSQLNWTLSVAAEIAVANNHGDIASQLFERILFSGEPDIASRLAYSDVLFQQQDHARVLQILDGLPPQTAVLIRLARARSALNPDDSAKYVDAARLSLIRAETLDGPDLQLRNRALFELWLTKNGANALRAAKANWRLQKSFEDSELLRVAARSAGDSDTLQVLAKWQRDRQREVAS